MDSPSSRSQFTKAGGLREAETSKAASQARHRRRCLCSWPPTGGTSVRCMCTHTVQRAPTVDAPRFPNSTHIVDHEGPYDGANVTNRTSDALYLAAYISNVYCMAFVASCARLVLLLAAGSTCPLCWRFVRARARFVAGKFGHAETFQIQKKIGRQTLWCTKP